MRIVRCLQKIKEINYRVKVINRQTRKHSANFLKEHYKKGYSLFESLKRAKSAQHVSPGVIVKRRKGSEFAGCGRVFLVDNLFQFGRI